MILQIALTAPYVIKGSASRHRRDSLALKCLAYESLRLVQNPGNSLMNLYEILCYEPCA